MRVERSAWTSAAGWTPEPLDGLGRRASVVLAFGARHELEKAVWAIDLRRRYPAATIVGCSTAGNIDGETVTDDGILATTLGFEATLVRAARVNVTHPDQSEDAGRRLAYHFDATGLRHVLVFADGNLVNGTALVDGLRGGLPPGVALTGGLAGDGDRFERTYVSVGGASEPGNVVALGFYGDRLRVGYGSLGGWESWGTEHLVTHARRNLLERLDGERALDVYKRQLGASAAGLPSSGLLFPFEVHTRTGESYVRTLLQVNERDGTITLAGDAPIGSKVRLMRANFARLIEGASGAANATLRGTTAPQFGLVISCIGRRLLLKERTSEELAAVQEVLGRGVPLAGFYSYGEICPSAPNTDCELHNQTMTITTFTEA